MRRLVVVLAALAWTVPAAAQDDPLAPDSPTAGATLDSLVVAASVQPLWRGLLLGTGGARGFADFALAGRPVTTVGPWGVSAHVAGAVVADARALAPEGYVGGGLTLSRYLDTTDAAIALVTEAYVSDYVDGVEIGIALRSVEWAWGLEEVNPELGVALYRDVGGFEGTRVELDFLLHRGIQNLAFWGFRDVNGWVEASGSWSDYRLPEGTNPEDHAWRAGLGLALDRGFWEVSLGVGAQDPRDAGIGMDAELALRLRPLSE